MNVNEKDLSKYYKYSMKTFTISNTLNVNLVDLVIKRFRAIFRRKSLGILISSELLVASYIYTKLSYQKLSSITVSCLPNHTLNFATDFLLQSLCPFQLLTDFS